MKDDPQAEYTKFQTTLQFLTVSPMLNIGGFLVGVNIGVPILPGTSKALTSGANVLRLTDQATSIDASNLQLFVEPRVGVQVALLSIKNVGTLFLNANASYSLPAFGSPIKSGALGFINSQTEKALLALGYTEKEFRFPNADATRKRFDDILVQPFSISAGLSFLLNFTNKAEQEEFLQEERRADSIRSLSLKSLGQAEYLRKKSIALADSAINIIIASSNISDRIAKAEQAIAEKQKQVLRTQLTETKKKVFQAQVTSITGTREDGTEVENPTLRVEQFAASSHRALLPAVFFDQGSAIPSPARYRRIQSAERETYKIPSDAMASPTSTYAHLLNIIGKRMSASAAKLTITGQQTRDEADAKLAEKRAEAVATYLMDVWKIPASRLQRITKPTDASNQVEKRAVTFSSDNAEILAPLTIDYTTRLASPPVINVGMEITTGVGLKQWELEFQQVAENQPITLKEARGGDPAPQRYEWRLNEEVATIPQFNEPVTVRIGAFDINNAAAPDPPLKSIKVEQVSLADKRKNGSPDKKVSVFECLFGTSLSEMDASSKSALDEAKRTITPQSRVSISVFGGNANVSARSVAQALNLDAKTAVLRDAGTPAITGSLPEAEAYKRFIRIRVESPSK